MKALLKLGVLVVAAAVLFPSAGFGKAPDEDVDIVESGDVTSWSYSPTALTVVAGTAVTWRNGGAMSHSITSQDQLFDSKLLDADKSWSYTFETPGTYRYFCVPRPWMKGTIVVTAADDSGARQTGGTTSGGSVDQSDDLGPRPTAAPTSAPTSFSGLTTSP